MQHRLSARQLLVIFFLGLGYTVVYATPFIQYVFYDALVDALQCTQKELGFLITIFGIGNILAAFGGVISDRFNARKVYLFGFLCICAINVFFAFTLSYKTALISWAGFAFTALFLYFPAHIKLARLVGSDEQQGSIFGFVEAFCGLTNVIVNFVALYFFTRFATENYGVAGLRAAILTYAIIGVVAAVVLFFLLPDPDKVATPQDNATESTDVAPTKIGLSVWIKVLTHPRTWMSGIAVFATYTMYCTLTYYTPYFSDVLGASVAFTGSIAIFRTYGTRFIGAPLGGWLGDKLGSLSAVIGVSLFGALVCVLAFLFMPQGVSANVLIAMTIITAVLVYMARGSMFAVPTELDIPREYAGSVSGLVCCLGYAPDLFLFVLYGHWLDTYGTAGYTRIFLFASAILILGILNSVAVLWYKKRHKLKDPTQATPF